MLRPCQINRIQVRTPHQIRVTTTTPTAAQTMYLHALEYEPIVTPAQLKPVLEAIDTRL